MKEQLNTTKPQEMNALERAPVEGVKPLRLQGGIRK